MRALLVMVAMILTDTTGISSLTSQAHITSANLYQLPDGGIAANCVITWPVLYPDGGLFENGTCTVHAEGGTLSTTIGQVVNACNSLAPAVCTNFN